MKTPAPSRAKHAPKRPLVSIAASLCAGIAVSPAFNAGAALPFAAAASLILLSALFINRKALSHLCLYLGIFFVGVFSCDAASRLEPNHISFSASDEPVKVALIGRITDDPVISGTGYGTGKITFLGEADYIRDDSGWHKTAGLVKVDSCPRKENFGFGDRIVLEGRLSRLYGLRNPGTFDYSRYMGLKNIYATLKIRDDDAVRVLDTGKGAFLKSTAFRLRRWMRDTIDAYLGPYYGGFLKAILIGDRRSLKRPLEEDFIKTGTVHIIAVSGLQVGLIAAIFMFLFGLAGFPRKVILILTMAGLLVYSIAAGSSPPIKRAVIMFWIMAAGYLMNRDEDLLNSLSAAALAILLWNPKELFDPGFQLSFASIAAIGAMAPAIENFFSPAAADKSRLSGRLRSYVVKSVSLSTAAWLGVWPFIASYFNIVSPIAVVANIFIIPLLFILMAASIPFLLAGPIAAFPAAVLASAMETVEKCMFSTAHLFARIPFSYFRIGAPPLPFSILYYALISMGLFPKTAVFGPLKIKRSHLLISILLALNAMAWNGVFPAGERPLKITFFDAGQGDAALAEFPDGAKVLVDAGTGGEERLDIGRFVIAPYLWNSGIRRVDAVIATHFHEDHLGGMPYILENFDVNCVVDNGAVADASRPYRDYARSIRRKGIRRLTAAEGDEIYPLGDAKVFVLNPARADGETLTDSNDNSLVIKLIYGENSVLLCGDITGKVMERLSRYGDFLKSDIMKIPHHGSFSGDDFSAVRNFFERVSPKVCFISAGRTGRFKGRLTKVVETITSSNSKCYMSSDTGALTVFVSPKDYEVKGVKEKI